MVEPIAAAMMLAVWRDVKAAAGGGKAATCAPHRTPRGVGDVFRQGSATHLSGSVNVM
jgi:hypothetical protein